MRSGHRRISGDVSRNKPRILCIEWIDPFFTAGHWIPQMVEIAGGINALSSREVPQSVAKISNPCLSKLLTTLTSGSLFMKA